MSRTDLDLLNARQPHITTQVVRATVAHIDQAIDVYAGHRARLLRWFIKLFIVLLHELIEEKAVLVVVLLWSHLLSLLLQPGIVGARLDLELLRVL